MFTRKPAFAGVFAAAVIALSTIACTQMQQDTARSYQAQVAAACSIAMQVAPLPEVVGACLTEAAIAKVALDPSTLEWLNGIVARMRG